jgi:hypothetical protein
MNISAGTERYNEDVEPVIARGVSFTEAELETALIDSVLPIIWDDTGAEILRSILRTSATTEFSMDNLERILSTECMPENWRVGESLAEAFLIEHKDCEFPWPSGRDLRNPRASPAGTDLVGFQLIDPNDHRFAFGEVKTSNEKSWPPSAINGHHGLKKQFKNLRDSTDIKDFWSNILDTMQIEWIGAQHIRRP